MPSRDPDLRLVERLLRATAPPAAVTVDFRQRVVQASLDARLRQYSRRQARRSMLLGLVAAGILLMPFGLAVATLTTATHAASPAEFRATQLTDTGLTVLNSTDGGEVLAIEQQLEARMQSWLAAQRSSRP